MPLRGGESIAKETTVIRGVRTSMYCVHTSHNLERKPVILSQLTEFADGIRVTRHKESRVVEGGLRRQEESAGLPEARAL